MTTKKKKIDLVLVDDEDDFRSATAEALERRGFVVRTAESGARGLELIRDSTPDIVLLDLRMEGLDGIDTLTEIRTFHEDLPVLILTGHGGFDDALAGIHLDIVDFVQKPVAIERLAERIRGLLDQGQRQPLREPTIERLMVPLWTYQRIYDDEPLHRVLRLLHQRLQSPAEQERGRRTVLVFDRDERFIGCIRPAEVLAAVVPPFLRDMRCASYASYFTGMVLAQCKMLGKHAAGDLVSETSVVRFDAPLMEAVHLMAQLRLITIPVVDGTEVIGILRDHDLLREVARAIVWEEAPG